MNTPETPRLSRRTPLIIALVLVVLAAAAAASYRHLDRLWAAITGGGAVVEGPAPSSDGPVTLQWVGCDICKASFMDKAAELFEKKTGHKVLVEDGGASRGIWEVSRGAAHLGGTCRQCCYGEKDEQGVKLLPIAWDCLVVIVNQKNPLENISLEQLRDIYTGKVTRWEQLAGASYEGPILAVARAGKRSGVGFSTRQYLFKDIDKDYTAPLMLNVKSSRLVEEALEEKSHAIGITGYNSARLRVPPSGKLKMLKLEGKAPTRDNVINGDYLFYRPLYMSLPTQDVHPVAEQFVAFLFSREGQEIMRSTETITLEEGKGLWDKYKKQMQESAPADGP